jgi:hypothetical protein
MTGMVNKEMASNFLPNFGTVVSSTMRKSGTFCKVAEIKLQANSTVCRQRNGSSPCCSEVPGNSYLSNNVSSRTRDSGEKTEGKGITTRLVGL